MAKNINLGAPALISGTENSQASLSVQTMMRCRELTLAEGATQEGSIRTAARLLGQLREELQAETEQKALRVGFESKEAALAWFRPTDDPMTDGTMWQTGEEVVVEGLRLFVVKGMEKEAYALAHGEDVESVEDDAVTAWVEEIRYGSEADAESDGDIPVKDELVFWSCSDGKEGAWADVLPDGTVRGSYFLGSVRGALKANPQMAHADMWLALGLGNCTSEEWTEGMKLLEAKSGLKEVLDDADKAEVIAEVIAEYGIEWMAVFMEQGLLQELSNAIKIYPEIIDSLLGKNTLYFSRGQGGTLGLKMENNTTYHISFIKGTGGTQYSHILGTCAVMNSTPRLWIDIDALPLNEYYERELVTDATTDYSKWLDLKVASTVLFNDKSCDFAGWIFNITAKKEGLFTHYWVPISNGKFYDIISGKSTSWAVIYNKSLP